MTFFLAVGYLYGGNYLFYFGLGVNSNEGIPISLSANASQTCSGNP